MLACLRRGRGPAGSSFTTRHPSAKTFAVLRTNSPWQSLHLISQAALVQLTDNSTERSVSIARFSVAGRNMKAALLVLSHLRSVIALYKKGRSEAVTSTIL